MGERGSCGCTYPMPTPLTFLLGLSEGLGGSVSDRGTISHASLLLVRHASQVIVAQRNPRDVLGLVVRVAPTRVQWLVKDEKGKGCKLSWKQLAPGNPR